MEDQDVLQLGGNIQLSGFSGLDGGKMSVLKKIVGNYAKRLSEICTNFESLALTMKPVHETEASKIFEIHAKCMDGGKPLASNVEDRNLFIAIDSALKKVVNEVQK
jgi:ribosome-associated translation inhibitor RaiA